MLRDQQKKLELAARMRGLWEASGVTQEHIADEIGLKHRSYQKALQTGGISYDKLRKLATFHGVDFDWLVRGDQKETKAPDPFTASNSSNGNADLSEIKNWMQALTEAVIPLLAQAEAEQLRRLADNAQRPPEEPPESASRPGG